MDRNNCEVGVSPTLSRNCNPIIWKARTTSSNLFQTSWSGLWNHILVMKP